VVVGQWANVAGAFTYLMDGAWQSPFCFVVDIGAEKCTVSRQIISLLSVDYCNCNVRKCVAIHVLHYILHYCGVIGTAFFCTYILSLIVFATSS